MLILRYTNALSDGAVATISHCLEANILYNVGRSSKSQFSIKNDKSISRHHVSISWGYGKDNEAVLQIKNYGKVTMIKGRYLNQDEVIEYKNIEEAISIQIGTNPIDLMIAKVDVDCNEVQGEGLKSLLKKFMIAQKIGQLTSNLAFLIAESHITWYLELYALVSNLIILSQGQLEDLLHSDDFDSLWKKLKQDRKYVHNSELLASTTCYYLSNSNDENDYLQKSINTLGGKLECFHNEKDLINELKIAKETNDSLNYFFFTSEGLELNSLPNSYQVTSKTNLTEAIKYDKTDKINMFHFKNKDTIGIKNVFSNETPPIKRRRLNRTKVKPLDSLAFFAGGVPNSTPDIINSNENSTEPATLKNNECTTNSNHDLEEKKIQSPKSSMNNDTEPNTVCERPANFNSNNNSNSHDRQSKKSNKKVDKLVNDGLFPEMPASNKTVPPKMNNLVESQESPKIRNDSDHSNMNLIGERINERLSSEIENRELLKGQTLPEYDNNHPTQNKSLVQTIQEVKSRGINRVNSHIITVNENELEEGELNKLSNLAIVEVNTNLKRPDKSDTDLNLGMTNIFAGKKRNNFKKFVKNVPRWKLKQHNVIIEYETQTNHNNDSTSTKNVISLKKYNSNENDDEGDNFEFPNINNHSNTSIPTKDPYVKNKEVDEHSFIFSRSSSKNQLFVHEDEDEDEDIDGNENDEVVPILNGISTEFPTGSYNATQKFINNSPNFNSQKQTDMPQPTKNFEQVDSDADSDDEPKFRFRNR